MSSPADVLREYLIDLTVVVREFDPANPTGSEQWNSVNGQFPAGDDYPNQYVAIMDQVPRTFAPDMRRHRRVMKPTILFNVRSNSYLDAYEKCKEIEEALQLIGASTDEGGSDMVQVTTEDAQDWVIHSVELVTAATYVGRQQDKDTEVFSITVRADVERSTPTKYASIYPSSNAPVVGDSLIGIHNGRTTIFPASSIGGGGTYSTTTPTTQTVGGVPAGTSFVNAEVTAVIDQILHAYLTPAFTAFGITGAVTQEVGQVFSGTKTFTWSTSNSGNVDTNSIAIADQTGSTTLGSGLPNNGSTSFAINVTHNSPATHVWSISGEDTNSDTFTDSFSISWEWRLFYGDSVSVTLNAAAIQALSGNPLATGFEGSYTYAGGGYKYIAFPDSFGGPSQFKDASTQLNIAMADSSDDASYSNVQNGFNYAIVSVTNGFSVATNYRVYRSKNVLGGAITIVVG